MTITMAEAKCKRNATATGYERHGLHDYASADEAQVALQNSDICYADLDIFDQTNMAERMWRNDTSPEDAAITFGLNMPGELVWQYQDQAASAAVNLLPRTGDDTYRKK